MTALDRGYADPRWGSWRQIREAGGYVCKGERGTRIMYVDWRQHRTACDEHGDPVLDGEGRPKLEAGPAARQAALRPQRRADGGAGTPVAPGCGAGVGRTRAGRSADPEQRDPDRPRGRRPGLLQLLRGPGGAPGAEPVPVAVGLHAHGAARAGARHRTPAPHAPPDVRQPRRLRVGDLRPRGAAGGDRRDDDGRAAWRRARATPRDGVRQFVD